MENETQQSIPPVQPLPQAPTPVPSPTNWLKILLFTVLGLVIVAGSVFAGIQIGKNQTFNSQPLNTTPTPSSTPLPIQASGSATIPPIPIISQISVCSPLSISLFPTLNPDARQICQIIELRTRDLLQATYNVHHLLREIQNGQIQQKGLNKVNDLNNNLVGLWLNIAGYGLGTDPYVNIHIMVSGSASSDARAAPSYGLSGGYITIGVPRLYNQYIESSSLSLQEIQRKETAFTLSVQPYANPAEYPFKDFFNRAYFSYRENKLLDSAEYKEDLRVIDVWVTSLEKVLEQIPSFLSS